MLFHTLGFVVSEANVNTNTPSEQQTGIAKLLQSLYGLILRCQSAQHIQLLYESGSNGSITQILANKDYGVTAVRGVSQKMDVVAD